MKVIHRQTIFRKSRMDVRGSPGQATHKLQTALIFVRVFNPIISFA